MPSVLICCISKRQWDLHVFLHTSVAKLSIDLLLFGSDKQARLSSRVVGMGLSSSSIYVEIGVFYASLNCFFSVVTSGQRLSSRHGSVFWIYYMSR